mgnify:CR=1 FL=1
MLEIIGYVHLRLIGMGWLWKKNEKLSADEVFGNGNTTLLMIGIYAPFFWAVVVWGICEVLAN